MDAFKKELQRRLDQKGYGTFLSTHEILGVLSEEFDEFEAAVHKNNQEEVLKELMDVAVGAVFGCSCVLFGTVVW